MEQSIIDAIVKVAPYYGLEPAALLAVKQVETGNGTGMLDTGEPEILFEGHVFYKFLKEVCSKTKLDSLAKEHPNVVYSGWDRSKYKGGIKEHSRLKEATAINRSLALKSASWGAFQIMGFNWKNCGCITLQEFINLNYKGLEEQVHLGCKFIKSNSSMYIKLYNKDWGGFAKLYNGEGYAANRYDQKLANAYSNFKMIY